MIHILGIELALGRWVPSKARAELKMILVPSGDQTGSLLLVVPPPKMELSSVSGMSFVPSALMDHTLVTMKTPPGLVLSVPSSARAEV